jgi:hypothetical protein
MPGLPHGDDGRKNFLRISHYRSDTVSDYFPLPLVVACRLFDSIANKARLMPYGTKHSACIAATAQEFEYGERAQAPDRDRAKPLRIDEKVGLIC